MANALSGAEIKVLAQTASETISHACHADVQNAGPLNPAFLYYIGRITRIFALEPASRALDEESSLLSGSEDIEGVAAPLFHGLQTDLLHAIGVFIWLDIGLYVLPITYVHETRPRKFEEGVWGFAYNARNPVIDPNADHRLQNHPICHRGVIIARTNQTAKLARLIEDGATAHSADKMRLDVVTRE